MKKIFIAAVLAFAFSQSSFAAVSFADLLKQEAASFIPKVEVQTFTTTTLDQGKEEYTNSLGEKISDYEYTTNKDESRDWRYEGKYSNGGGVEYGKIVVLSEEIHPNDPGDSCKSTKIVIYNSIDTHTFEYYEDYTSVECSSNGNNSYKCKEYEKKAYFEEIVEYYTTKQDEDTCYE